MKTQNRNLLIAILAIAFVIPFMSAAAISVTWNPLGGTTNYTNHTGSFTYNCTTSAHAVKNVTVYANSSASVMNALQVFTNTSALQTAWSGTVTITSADDGTNQNLSCFAQNGTVASVYSKEILGRNVMLDSTDPISSISRDHKTFAWKDTQKITWASSDAIELASTLVTINRPEDGADLTYSDASKVLTLTSQDTKYTGDWTATVLATDRAGNTDTESVSFKSYMPDGVGQEVIPVPKDNGQAILLILVVGAILYFIFKKN